MRQAFQTLIIPYKIEGKKIKYSIYFRLKQNIWQFISGGGEDAENPIQTAIREIKEETGIEINSDYLLKLDSESTIPVVNVTGKFTWGEDIFVVKEYCFGINISDKKIKLSNEHKKMEWHTYEECMKLLKYDSNKTALWELNERLLRGMK